MSKNISNATFWVNVSVLGLLTSQTTVFEELALCILQVNICSGLFTTAHGLQFFMSFVNFFIK